MSKITGNKYEYFFVLQGWYAQGWEDLTASETRKNMLSDMRAYRENEGGNYRIILRRELKGVQS